MTAFNHYRLIPVVLMGLLLCAAGLLWPESEYERPLTVALNIWPGTENLLRACEAENLKKRRINMVEMSWPTAVMGAFRKRVVDAAVVTLDEMIRLEADGAKPRAVLILGSSRGSDAIMGHASLPTMQSLRGKNIGVELRSASEHLLRQALSANGMTLQDVHLVPVNLAETEAAYDDEKGIDAVVSADPWCLRLLDKGAVSLFDTSHMKLEFSRVLVVREEALQNYAQELRSLVAACLESNARSGLLNSEEGQQDATLRREGFTLLQWQKSLLRIHLPDAEENRRLMTQKSGGLEECLEQMIAVMRSQGVLRREIRARDLLRPEFLEAVP